MAQPPVERRSLSERLFGLALCGCEDEDQGATVRERPVQPDERGHRRFPGLAGTQQEYAASIGAEESLLPAVGVDTEKASEGHAVRRYASLAVRPTRPET